VFLHVSLIVRLPFIHTAQAYDLLDGASDMLDFINGDDANTLKTRLGTLLQQLG
jgi:hypothetical protein